MQRVKKDNAETRGRKVRGEIETMRIDRASAFAQIRSRRASGWRGANDRVSRRRVTAESGDAREFLLDYGGELGHLLFHLDHFFAHVENDFDAGEIDAHVARQREDYVEALEIVVGVRRVLPCERDGFSRPTRS